MKVIPPSKLPKRHYTLAVECRVDFEQVLDVLKTKANLEAFDDGLPYPKRYRYVCLQLSTGQYGTISQNEWDTKSIEIGLQIKNDKFFHEADLIEILETLGIKASRVSRMAGDFVWLPANSSSHQASKSHGKGK